MTFYTVYRTQNIWNGRYYFGVHKTKNPYDGYLGSGKLIKRAVKKYGEHAFLKNVCFIFNNPERAFQKEHELIETYRVDPMCYNLREGGSGGFDWINHAGLNGTRFVSEKEVKKRATTLKHRLLTEPEFRTKMERVYRQNLLMVSAEGRHKAAANASAAWKGQKHSKKTRQVMSYAGSGSGNSQYGTCWVFKDGEARKIKKTEFEIYVSMGWIQGRKRRAG